LKVERGTRRVGFDVETQRELTRSEAVGSNRVFRHLRRLLRRLSAQIAVERSIS